MGPRLVPMLGLLTGGGSFPAVPGQANAAAAAPDYPGEAQAMQVRAVGRAASRPAAIGRPHRSHWP